MSKFTVRVELHDADDDDYEKLHEAMERHGFSRIIRSQDGETYHLPPAEYRYSSETETRGQVCNGAYEIANQVKRKPAILVTEGVVTWRGLLPADD